MKKWFAWFSLFTSVGTLFCCALPGLLVVLGMGATMAGLVTSVPQIIWFSQHKFWVFTGSAVVLAISGYMQYRARFMSCPIDKVKAEVCGTSRKWSLIILVVSVIFWVLGAFFAFIAPRIF